MKIKTNCFGKLPAYQDFVIYDCTDPLATEFRKWMETAFGHGTDDGSFLGGATFGLLIANMTRSEATIGLMRDSSDQGGLRSFPIALFITLPGKAVRKAAAWTSLLSLETIWQEIEEVERFLRKAPDLNAVHQRLRDWKPEKPAKDKKNDPLSTHSEMKGSLPNLISSLGGAEGDTPWNRLMWGIKQLAGVEEDWLARGGIRWPLIPGPDPCFQVDFFNQLLNMQRKRIKFKPLPELFTAIYPRRNINENTATILFRPLVNEDSALFRPGTAPPPGILDLTGSHPPLTLNGFYEFQSELWQALNDQNLTIGDLFRLHLNPEEKVHLAQGD